MSRFRDRADAGRALARALAHYAGADTLVLGLPRGGVPVAYEIARVLDAELDVLVVRKLGVPFQPELAMGAIASGGALARNEDVIRLAGVSDAQFGHVRAAPEAELRRREALFRGRQAAPRVAGRVVIVVDDGLATGSSMRAALAALRSLKPARLVAAVPVAPADAAGRLAGVADDFVCLEAPEHFAAVGQFYEDFRQTTDEDVRALLRRSHPSALPERDDALREAPPATTNTAQSSPARNRLLCGAPLRGAAAGAGGCWPCPGA